MWGQPPSGHGRSLLAGAAGRSPTPSQGACSKHLGAEMCAACGGVMLPAESKAAQSCCAGRTTTWEALKDPAIGLPEHPLDAPCCFLLCCRNSSPDLLHKEMHKTQKCQVPQGCTHLCCLDRNKCCSSPVSRTTRFATDSWCRAAATDTFCSVIQ